ncbi:carboxylate--amine ligase [Aeromicrobium sp. PE09-221]|uniref:PAC2 family protein n=1 Tax=Aeromicrobium sp. PE09-221 TaxID=1898043 RepID=UPI000B3E68C6|nr:PAC2 family protein [Aeromicrobium sp. PE09-221]OUZ08231.1 carboxylate--amine ligase [Aeromicrobium sp. PE09-221]
MTANPSETLRNPWLVAAFEGWNDAADASSDVISHLVDEWDAEVYAEFDGDDYYDFQETRPIIRGGDVDRRIDWPTPTVYLARPPHGDRDVLLLRAPEPHLRWRAFTRAILELATMSGVRDVVCLGALLADTPHTRTVPLTGSSTSPAIADKLAVASSAYSGPVGITGVVAHEAAAAGFESTSLWAAVPHYLAEPPCPKATFALLGALEDTLGTALPAGELGELAAAWQRGADEIAQQDLEIAEYVRSLEEEHDAGNAPESSGDAIAREFERYLRRRDLGS